MNKEALHEVRCLFEAAIKLSAAEQPLFLREACHGDVELEEYVGRLLRARDMSPDFLSEPALKQAAAKHSLIGQRFGGYKIIREIGSGGMGVVYLAIRDDGVFERRVAVKIIRPMLDDDSFVTRFQRERTLLAKLDHPNIARIIDGGSTAEGLPYFLMDYVEGVPINTFCKKIRSSLQAKLELMQQLCGAVDYLHKKEVLHRDLKPPNVLVTESGSLKLLDFGIAKLVDAGLSRSASTSRLYTPSYASPEQIRGSKTGVPTDVFSLGVILYELLWDELPFDPSDLLRSQRPKAFQKHRRGNAHIDKDLKSIVEKALQHDPELRYRSAASFSRDLRRYLVNEPVNARGNERAYVLSKNFQQHRMRIAVSLMLAVLLSWAAVATIYVHREREDLHDAQQRLDVLRRQSPQTQSSDPATIAQLREQLESYRADAKQVVQPILAKPINARDSEEQYIASAVQYLLNIAPTASHDPGTTAELAHALLDTARLDWSPDSPSLDDPVAAEQISQQALEVLSTIPGANDPAGPVAPIADALRNYSKLLQEESRKAR